MGWTIFCLILPLLILTWPVEGFTCPGGYKPRGNICYKYFSENKSWDDATKYCREHNGQELISWDSNSDGEYFRSIARAHGENVWIGLRRFPPENIYFWSNGHTAITEYSGHLWALNEPSLNTEDCGLFYNVKDYKLNDDECFNSKPFICKACKRITYCTHTDCRSGPSSIDANCTKCEFLYKPSPNKKTCMRTCEYDNPCWPGTCQDDYKDRCQCAEGFTKRIINSQITCQPTASLKPSIDTCLTTMSIPRGEKISAKSNSTSMECSYMQNFYGNFQPQLIEFDITATFDVNTTAFPNKPSFITTDVKFGITDGTVTAIKHTPRGSQLYGHSKHLLVDAHKGTDAKRLFTAKGNLNATKGLTDGDRLCLHIDVQGGGYITTEDVRTQKKHHYEYVKVKETRYICYIMDTTMPKSTAIGDVDPFEVHDKISRSGIIHIAFNNWIDPTPSNGDETLASGIEHFAVSAYEMTEGIGILSMGTNIVQTRATNASVDPRIELTINSKTPKLLCLLLEVKDVADNVRHARRFVLYDNTSFLEIVKSNSFTVTSASPQANNKWQTHHNDICISWKDYFVNRFYQDNHVLQPIKANPNISGIYEQQFGDISISGTQNVNGIIAFNFSWSSHGRLHHEGALPNLLGQTHCQGFNLSDGQTYILNVTATDIVNNTITDSRTVSIDRSVPHINHLWLLNNGYESLFAHGDANGDLTEIDISFEVLDPHSGVEEIEWAFGVSDHGREMIAKNIAINESDSCDNKTNCMCPDVGKCQITKYLVSLKGNILKQGNHNRNYYFTIKATNNARLFNIEHMEILVDTSPPETGVVFEGPIGSKDIDYTSKTDFMVRWHGFIDHESGIKLYRIALADRCLSRKEMSKGINLISRNESVVDIHEVPFTEESVRMNANFTGKYYVSVVALNNAAEVSEPACSDGITRDKAVPTFQNISLLNGRWKESLHCINGHAWLLHSSLQKVRLADVNACAEFCINSTGAELPSLLIERSVDTTDEMISEFICNKYDFYESKQLIYLPDDHLEVSWDMREDASQIFDYYVGFGNEGTKSVKPNLMAYESTNRRTIYRRNHAGFALDDLFYMFIKAVNKAGLEKVIAFGPIVIDETPPVEMKKAVVTIDAKHVTVEWDNETFIDPEQEDNINSIMFQFESDGEPITPLHEWNKYESVSCSHNVNGGCVKFPIRRLQSKDTQDGRDFTLALFVYNNAGHMVRSTTNSFKIPSKYPPGHGTVVDLDPAKVDSDTDISGHISEHILCCGWSGFDHHENVSVEIAVGSAKEKSDIHPFKRTINNGSACLSSPNFLTNVRYFITLRFTCTGGTTLSTSNGVTIINQTELVNSLNVYTGIDCKQVPKYNSIFGTMSNFINDSFSLSTRFRVGQSYFIQLTNNVLPEKFDFGTSDGILEKLNLNSFRIIPFKDRPVFRFKHDGLNKSLGYNMSVWQCTNGSYLNDISVLNGHWTQGMNIGFHVRYEISLGMSCKSEKSSELCVKTLTPFKRASSDNSASVIVSNLHHETAYIMLVRPCIDSRCFQYVSSNEVVLATFPRNFEVLEATIENNRQKESSKCSSINIWWKVSGNSDRISFFQWGISKDKRATALLTKWSTILPNGTNNYNTSSCFDAPTLGHETLYACVRAFTWSSSSQIRCVKLKTASEIGINNQVVYDFDASQVSWYDVKKLLGSRYLGSKETKLHDSEIDFGSASTIVAGAMPMVSERNVTWYVMTSAFVPVTCSLTSDCITSVYTTLSGFSTFHKDVIPKNRFLYICAFSEVTSIRRESHVESFEEIMACSDGFIIDTIRPTGGHLVVPNHNRYISDIRNTIVFWDNFTDNVNAEVLGYSDDFKHYSVCAGTSPGSDDLHQMKIIGQEHTYIFDRINVTDGTYVYVTITGTDQAGLQATVTSELMTVDNSGPSTGQIEIDQSRMSTPVVSSDHLSVYLSGFEDPHSGIDYFDIGVGSRIETNDVLSVREMTNNVFLSLNTSNHVDGARYYINVQAVNRAGLQSETVSKSFTIDRSPPVGGHVLDGTADNNGDLDYQDNDTYIAGHWYGFSDSHSGISYYRVGLGSRVFLDDEETFMNVGLRTNVIWKKNFIPGTKYFITVEACNQAGSCSRISSDGIVLDTSRPITGIVRVGHSDTHGKYHAKSSSLHMQWVGFSDPESGIDHFEACIGSVTESCDIHPYFNCLLSSSITKTGLNLPRDEDIYVTVKAINRVGKSTVTSSNSFRIDNTAPTVLERPAIVRLYNYVDNEGYQYDPSVLRVKWRFGDSESPIVKHHVTLKTHHEGHSPIDNIDLGSTDRVTFSLDQVDWLHNGDSYYVIVTSCNEAGLCSSAESDDIVIDYTSPHQGGFTSDLTWRNIEEGFAEVSLAWHSFIDAESKIREFYITISRNYSGSELSEGIIITKFDNSSNIQQGSFNLTKSLHQDDALFLTIWAKNNAGLNSSISRISVNVLVTSSDNVNIQGILEIEKHSCKSQYCSGDCTCAVIGKPCEKSTCSSNTSHPQIDTPPHIDIYWGLPKMTQTITTSSACLAAHWNITFDSNHTGTAILRFEYSIGLAGDDYGAGIFRKDRIPWVDVGLIQEVVHCLTDNTHLRHGVQFVFYVRTWFSRDTFNTVNSSVITIDQTPPSIKKGAYIKDSDNLCQIDLDLIDWMDTITACWDKVFVEQQGHIIHYTAALGTSENADDVIVSTDIGLQTSLTITNISMQHGTKYFFTVTAYNNVGLHTTLSSDGFVIDMDNPRKGVVFNTERFRNANFQSETSMLAISWNGFTDTQSGIRFYLVALVEDKEGIVANETFVNVGLRTQHTFDNISLVHGRRYYGVVKAIDHAGHESEAAVSPRKTIDITRPFGFNCVSFEELESESVSKTNGDDVSIAFGTNYRINDLYKVMGETSKSGSEVDIFFTNGYHRLRLPTTTNHKGIHQFEYTYIHPKNGLHNTSLILRSKASLSGSATLLKCNGTIPENSKAVNVQQIGPNLIAVTILIQDIDSLIYEVQVGVGSTTGGFQLRPLHAFSGGNNGILEVESQHGAHLHVTAIAENYAGQKATFHSNSIVWDHTGPEIVLQKAYATNLLGTDGRQLGVTLRVNWTAIDRESGLRQCYCSFGHLPGSEDLMTYTQADSNTFCTSPTLYLPHGTTVYGNVRCVNNVELKTDNATEGIAIIYLSPSANESKVSFLQQQQLSHGLAAPVLHLSNGSNYKEYYIQSRTDTLSIEWNGFNDVTGIDRYAYRITNEGKKTVISWTETMKHSVNVPFHGNHLLAGQTYTAEVKAVNKNDLESMSAKAHVFVDDREPKLTGKHVLVVRTGRHVKINWQDVFQPHPMFSCSFDVTLGSRKGFADLADVDNTVDLDAEVNLPDTSFNEDPITELFVGILCEYPTGLYRKYTYNHRSDVVNK